MLSRSLPAVAALPLAGTEPRLSTAASLLTATRGSGRAWARKSRTAVRSIPVVAGVAAATVTMWLCALIAAKMPVASLTNGEVGQPALFFLPLDARKLRANKSTMHRPFLDLRPGLVVFFTFIDGTGHLVVIVGDRIRYHFQRCG